MPLFARLTVLLLSLALAACGGSGGGAAGGTGGGNGTIVISGSVSGLTGTLVLRNNGGDPLTLNANGAFAFATAVAAGASYLVTVQTQPGGQTCVVSGGSGVALGTVAGVVVTCTVNPNVPTHTVGGTISGLNGSITLRNNGTNNLTTSTNGNFTFTNPVNEGGSYNVSVLSKPTGQTCVVTNGIGTANVDVTGVVVTCSVSTYTIGGTVSGLNGSITLQDNGGDDLTLLGNGTFTFATKITHGGTYSVTLVAQPASQVCAIGNGGGTATTNVGNVSVNCVTRTYSLGGTVSGLNGSVTLQNNGGDNLVVDADGSFSFATPVSHGTDYAVSVLAQPTGQSCVVSNGSGTMAGTVGNVGITCTTRSYAVGGTISGLVAGSLTLRNNGGDDRTFLGDGTFQFLTPVAYGGTYDVTVATQPAGLACGVASGNGKVGAGDVTSVSVTCINGAPAAPVVSLSASPAPKEIRFTWPSVDGTAYYRLYKDPDGASGYTQVGGDITGTSAGDVVAVHRHDWTNASYLVEACNAFGCTASSAVTTSTRMLEAIGYIKAGNTDAGDFFGSSVALSGDGRTLAVGAPCESSNGTGASDNSSPCAGAVYIYARAADNSWSQVAYYKAPAPDSNDAFGRPVALSADGNTLAVGAIGRVASFTDGFGNPTPESGPSGGAVFVFTRSGGTWQAGATTIQASNASSQDLFGGAIALSADGSTLVAGAIGEASNATGIDGDQANNTATMAGAAYVFTRSGASWTQQAYIKASNTDPGDLFGNSVALSADGDTLAVGAAAEAGAATGIDGNQADNGATLAGAVYVFARSGATWSQQAYVKASNTESGDQFGYAVALASDGNTLAVGASGEDSSATGVGGAQTADAGTSSSGAAYVFTRSGATWSQQAYVKASNTDGSDQFGSSIALAGDGATLAVGAIGEGSAATGIGGAQGDNSATLAGAVYVYALNGGWQQAAYVKAPNTGAQDLFGRAVALSSDGGTLAVGADGEDSAARGVNASGGGSRADNSRADAGAAYLY